MHKLRSINLQFCLGLVTLATASLAPGQTIFSVTESATPGQPIVLTGDGFDATTQLTFRAYNRSGKLGEAQDLTVKNQNAMTVGTEIPSDIGTGVYRIEAKSLFGNGDSVLINAPRVTWVNQSEVAPGSTVRLIGRNFQPTRNVRPTVRLVDTETGESFTPGTPTQSNYEVAFYVPLEVEVGHTYKIFVNSNVAGEASEVAAPTTISVREGGGDAFALGMPWSSEFDSIANNVINIKTDDRLSVNAKGNGKSNDARALQAAVQLAYNTGGGTVYLPKGTYNVDDGTTVYIPPKVVLMGEGGKTVLRVGYRFTSTVKPGSVWPISFLPGQNSGLFNLAIQNDNENEVPNLVLRYQSSPAQPMVHTFMRYVKFDLGNAKAMTLPAIRGAVIAGCKATNTAMWNGPLYLNGSRDLHFFNNSFKWKGGRIYMNMSARNIVEKNTLQVDNTDYGNKAQNGNLLETGGFETSYSQNVYFKNNDFQGYGKGDNTVECEFIMNQRSIVKDFWAAGNVLLATPTTITQLTDWSGSWQAANYDDLDRSFVAITKGKGAGQIRRVKSHDTFSLTIDKPWDVVPDLTSVYAVGSFNALDQTIVDNTMADMHCGVMFWNGGVDNVVANNTLKDSGFILIRSDSQPDPRGEGRLSQSIAWHNSIVDNTIKTSRDRYVGCISLSSNITRPVAERALMGNLALDNTIRGNDIKGSKALHDWVLFRYDGIEICNYNELGRDLDSLLNLGFNVHENTIDGSLMPYRYVNL